MLNETFSVVFKQRAIMSSYVEMEKMEKLQQCNLVEFEKFSFTLCCSEVSGDLLSWYCINTRNCPKCTATTNFTQIPSFFTQCKKTHSILPSKYRTWILAFSTNFCTIDIDLSGNTIWPPASGFQKLAKIGHFGHFKLTFVHSKCKHSLLRSQCWMRLFSVIVKHRILT